MRFQEGAESKPDTFNMPSLIRNRQNRSSLLKHCCKGVICLPAVKLCLDRREVGARLSLNTAIFPSVHKSGKCLEEPIPFLVWFGLDGCLMTKPVRFGFSVQIVFK